MLCISLGKTTFENCKRTMQTAEMVELRLDLLRLSEAEIEELCQMDVPIIATCRVEGYRDEERKKLLKLAIRAGASHVDIEIEATTAFKKELIEVAQKNDCQVIVSYHNYEETPPKETLQAIIQQCFEDGADIAKLATLSRSTADSGRLLGLYDTYKKIVALGMGGYGKITRVAAPFLGAPFTFVALNQAQLTAPGQLDLETMKEVLLRIEN